MICGAGPCLIRRSPIAAGAEFGPQPDRSRQRRRFSGLVLAILGFPVSADRGRFAKSVFLREAARITEANVTIRACRAQAVPPHAADIVTARACARSTVCSSSPSDFFFAGHPVPISERRAFRARIDPRPQSLDNEWSVEQSLSDRRGVIISIATGRPWPHQA